MRPYAGYSVIATFKLVYYFHGNIFFYHPCCQGVDVHSAQVFHRAGPLIVTENMVSEIDGADEIFTLDK